jgi:hypothetical protein
MISCKKATQLISRKMDEGLSFWENILLLSHTVMCWCCRRFERQTEKIRESIREISHEIMAFERYQEIGMPELSPEAKQRLIAAIRRHHSL